MRIVFNHGATTRGIDQDRLNTGFNRRPPGVDVAPRIVHRAGAVIEVMTNRTTAATRCGHHCLNAKRIQHSYSGRINGRNHGRLHAAFG